ncbi:FKBP-type peptidyl-prolyl cis-trans isomerase [Cyclobacterium roseum]|uniref:FKBP-type peptidyl-prolyl cis-trans isomerase n=1 Tax=Cyclobacterium roseum TaxID=2666137 RepID=UPI001F39E360|nr:FKBP-type peptidyl-prolyl cis-trans isomerase [Cyclobacterium roseum]
MRKSTFILALIPVLGTISSCISDEENLDAVFEQDLQKIEQYIQTVETEYTRRETIGQTGIELLFLTEQVESEELPEVRDTLAVNYTGMLLDGTVFDTSLEQVAQENDVFNPNRTYEPYEVVLGMSNVINGWHWSLSQMKEGEKAIALIPSSYAYGNQSSGPIPANSVLVFELDLVEVRPYQP